MLKNRKDLDRNLKNILAKTMIRRNIVTDISSILKEKHNVIAEPVISDVIMGLSEPEQLTEEYLYWVCECVAIALKNNMQGDLATALQLDKYFTQKEILLYSKSKKISTKITKYPIVFSNVTQVNADQWICVKDVDFIYDLYQKQVINYNINTQRDVTRKVVNGIQTYKITVNESSVDAISTLLKNGTFISNPITLNINLDDQNIQYEFKDNEIIVYNGMLDIIDGYHRYRAIIKTKTENASFNYNFIINIMNFTQEKACTYIGQEDKRNKISRAFSQSLDSSNLLNLIPKRLNEDHSFYLYGKVGRLGDEVINAIDFSSALSLVYKNEIKDQMALMNLTKNIRTVINGLLEERSDILNGKISYAQLLLILMTLKKSDKDCAQAVQVIVRCYDKISAVKITQARKTKVMLAEIDNIIKKELGA